MLGVCCWRQKRGLFWPVFAFLKAHSGYYVTEKRLKMAKKESFGAQQENPRHALSGYILKQSTNTCKNSSNKSIFAQTVILLSFFSKKVKQKLNNPRLAAMFAS